jgi:hypothetical protein
MQRVEEVGEVQSFRLRRSEILMLENLKVMLHESRSEIVRRAIRMYYEQMKQQHKKLS